MKNVTKIMALSALAGAASLLSTEAEAKKGKMEKCYGVVKAGMNQCGSEGHACATGPGKCATEPHKCAGMSKHDADPAEWVYVPKGLCEKLVNGSLKSGGPKK